MADNEVEKIDELFLLDKRVAKYQQEVSRSVRLEAKITGFYTILGIYFAAFLVIFPITLENALQLSGKPMRFCIWLVLWLTVAFLFSFFVSILTLHNKYNPKSEPDFDFETYWERLLSQSKKNTIISLHDNLNTIIKEFGEINEKTANSLKLVNTLCVVATFIIASCLFLSFVLIFIIHGGNFYG